MRGSVGITAVWRALSGSAFAEGPGDTFNTAAVWRMVCTLEPLPRAGTLPQPGAPFEVAWYRDAGVARMIWADGNGKGLREIEGFSDGIQAVAHVWYSPATSKITGEATANSRYGGWIEGFGPGFFSVRSSGEAGFTTHDIPSGGMQARSAEGRFDLTPLPPGTP